MRSGSHVSAVTNVDIFWHMAPCNVYVNQHFRGMNCPHLWVPGPADLTMMEAICSSVSSVHIQTTWCYICSSVSSVHIQTTRCYICSSVSSVHIQTTRCYICFSVSSLHIQTMRCYIPQDGNIHNYRCENLKSQTSGLMHLL
jgi:hypothetical protein